jgi:hypothetical protein
MLLPCCGALSHQNLLNKSPPLITNPTRPLHHNIFILTAGLLEGRDETLIQTFERNTATSRTVPIPVRDALTP